MNLPEHFNAAAFFVDRHVTEGRGGRTAFRFAGRSVTYAELAERVDRAASTLAARGVEIEDRVLLVLDDTPAFAAAFWGAVKLGAVAVPVNTLMAPAEYEFLLNDSRAKVAVVEAHLAEQFFAQRARCPWLHAVFGPSDLEGAAGARVEATATFGEDEGELRPGRSATAMVFQEFALFPWRMVQANVEFGLGALGVGTAERASSRLGAHQFLGGVVTDLDARSTIPNLFAAGDAADSVQGADRINGSGIMKALVFGGLAGAGAVDAHAQDARPALPAAYARESRHGLDRLSEWRRRLQTEMDGVLAVRDRARLAALESRLAENLDVLERDGLAGETPAVTRAMHELRSALTTSVEVVRASLRREHDLGLFTTSPPRSGHRRSKPGSRTP